MLLGRVIGTVVPAMLVDSRSAEKESPKANPWSAPMAHAWRGPAR
jgi:hypothetical protein